jgi:hypothetical protein
VRIAEEAEPLGRIVHDCGRVEQEFGVNIVVEFFTRVGFEFEPDMAQTEQNCRSAAAGGSGSNLLDFPFL